MKPKILGIVLLALVWGTVQAQRRTNQITPPDILRIATVSDAQISPNGQWVVYTVTTASDDKNINTLWLGRAGSDVVYTPPTVVLPTPTTPRPRRGLTDWSDLRSAPTPLLASGWSASNPRWSPDSSTIAFLSTRDDQSGLWTVKLDRREPRLVAGIQSTNFFITYAGESFSWSPDSRRIAYLSATAETVDVPGKRSDDPQVIDRIQYKSRTALSDNKRTHVFVADVDRAESRQLTSGPFYDHAVSFSPRGDEIIFLSNREADPDSINNSDIFGVDIGGQVRRITDTKGCEYDPVWSPDGKWIAYTATKREVTTIDSVAEDTHPWVIAASGGGGKELADRLDRRVRSPRWSADSRSLYFLANDKGYSTIFRVGIDGGKVSRFALFVVDNELAGVFDIEDTKFRSDETTGVDLAQPFQISSFSMSRFNLIRRRRLCSHWEPPCVLRRFGWEYPVASPSDGLLRTTTRLCDRCDWQCRKSLRFPVSTERKFKGGS